MKSVLDSLDHRNIDEDVDYFARGNVVSTTENIAVYIWREIRRILQKPELLYEVRIHETEKNSVIYRGEESS